MRERAGGGGGGGGGGGEGENKTERAYRDTFLLSAAATAIQGSRKDKVK